MWKEKVLIYDFRITIYDWGWCDKPSQSVIARNEAISDLAYKWIVILVLTFIFGVI